MPTLYIYPKKGEPKTFPLAKDFVSIGRTEDNSIPLADPFSSSHHATIICTEGGYRIRDNASKNGVFVNGRRILGEAELRPGDEILIGSTRLSFDRELMTNIEVTESPSSSASIHAAMPLQDILQMPPTETTLKAKVKPTDLERMKSEHRMFAVMTEVSRALLLHQPLHELLEHIMDLLGEHLAMDRGVLMLKEGNPEQLIPKVVRINDKSLKGQKFLLSQTIIRMVHEEKFALLTSDAAQDPRFMSQESIIRSNVHSAMCVPLWNNEQVIGIVYADRVSQLEQFSEEDLRLLTLLSNLAAVKIENARLVEKALEKERMEKELALAAQIQKDFLPKGCPDVPGFDIWGTTVPCFQVGGDYYDFFPVEPNRLGLVLADVSGKGIGAALLMASLRAALHSEVRVGYNLAGMASKLNAFVHRSSAAHSFITFFFGELNTQTGELAFINAGHNPPILLDPSGNMERLEPCGFCLGMFPESSYEIQRARVKPGGMALFFTDGLTESRNAGREEFGEERLMDFLKKNFFLKASEAGERLKEELKAFCSGCEPSDDMTFILLKRGER